MDDPKESASSNTEMLKGTPTGRIKSSDLLDFMERWQGNRLPTYLRSAMAALENSPEIPIIGTDFSALEDRVVAMMVRYKDGRLEVEHILEGDMFIRGQKAELVIIDEISPMIGGDLFRDLDRYSQTVIRDYVCGEMPPAPEPRMLTKPMKQNGKDASYLDLDPTKKHRRRRR